MSHLTIRFTEDQRKKIVASDLTTDDWSTLRLDTTILLVDTHALIAATVHDDVLVTNRTTIVPWEGMSWVPADKITPANIETLKALTNGLHYCKPHATVRLFERNATTKERVKSDGTTVTYLEHIGRCAGCRERQENKRKAAKVTKAQAKATAALSALGV